MLKHQRISRQIGNHINFINFTPLEHNDVGDVSVPVIFEPNNVLGLDINVPITFCHNQPENDSIRPNYSAVRS